jgi:curved DNA-binding protein CbpA
MQNYYDALDIPLGSSGEVIEKAYEAKLARLQAAGGPEKERRAQERLLNTAHFVLSNPQKRAEYDDRLSRDERRSEASSHFRTWAIPGAVVLALVGGSVFYAAERNKTRERIRMEEARLEREGEQLRMRAAADEAATERQREQSVRDQERQEYNAARERNRYSGREVSVDERIRQDQQYRANQEQREAMERQRAEERDRYQAEAERQRSVRDVERQKRYLQQQENEEAQARLRRHEAALQSERESRARDANNPPPDIYNPNDPRIRKR